MLPALSTPPLVKPRTSSAAPTRSADATAQTDLRTAELIRAVDDAIAAHHVHMAPPCEAASVAPEQQHRRNDRVAAHRDLRDEEPMPLTAPFDILHAMQIWLAQN